MSVTVPTVVGSAATVKLTQPKTTVDISVPKQMIVNLTRPTGPVETKLVLNRVTAKTPPGTILHVYVEAKGKPAHRKFVGTINWFIAFEREGGPDVRTVTFDITDEVKALGVGLSGLTLTFEASPGVVAPPAKGRLAAPAPKTATISPNSDLTIELVEIRQEPVK